MFCVCKGWVPPLALHAPITARNVPQLIFDKTQERGKIIKVLGRFTLVGELQLPTSPWQQNIYFPRGRQSIQAGTVGTVAATQLRVSCGKILGTTPSRRPCCQEITPSVLLFLPPRGNHPSPSHSGLEIGLPCLAFVLCLPSGPAPGFSALLDLPAALGRQQGTRQ